MEGIKGYIYTHTKVKYFPALFHIAVRGHSFEKFYLVLGSNLSKNKGNLETSKKTTEPLHML